MSFYEVSPAFYPLPHNKPLTFMIILNRINMLQMMVKAGLMRSAMAFLIVCSLLAIPCSGASEEYERHIAKGRAYLSEGLLGESESEFSKAVMLDPMEPTGLNNLGVVYLKQERVSEAIDLFNRALQLDPGSKSIKMNLAAAYESSGDESNFLRIMGSIEDPDVHYGLGRSFAEKKDHDRAYSELSAALELDPNHYDSLKLLSILLYENGSYDKAILVSKRVLEINPRHIYSMILAGDSYLELGEYEKASDYYNAALRANPGYELAKSKIKIAKGDVEHENRERAGYAIFYLSLAAGAGLAYFLHKTE
ncbi:MAG: tetratricopeptide repeat protein [Candidatus Altiarchaeales archaeon]|nr:tetratricopeptide repeat protein [Candidatus Altiarchaeales archaeon]MBD3415625.1 tetratricopeptide repeat protein [Candidatus Altiarchaeales archaeon]